VCVLQKYRSLGTCREDSFPPPNTISLAVSLALCSVFLSLGELTLLSIVPTVEFFVIFRTFTRYVIQTILRFKDILLTVLRTRSELFIIVYFFRNSFSWFEWYFLFQQYLYYIYDIYVV
jgi:hypothetical protein